MNILFLSHRIPYPPDKGDKIRSLNMIKHLSKKHRIFLGTIFDEEDDKNHIVKLKEYCREISAIPLTGKFKLLYGFFASKPFSVSNFYDPRLQKFVDTVLEKNNIQAVICFCSSMAEYVFKTPLYKKNKLKGIRLIMDFVDLDSDKWRQYAQFSKGIMKYVYKIEWKQLFKYEVKINRTFHHSIFISPKEAAIFKEYYPEMKNISIVPNGVDHQFFSPDQVPVMPELKKYIQGPMLVFTGRMDYLANVNGVIWFCRQVFPKIRKQYPDVQFYIVGNKPSDAIWALTEMEGITVTGYVEDIREYYKMADVCVTPLKIARGLQNKVLEAMAMGKAVVATSSAKTGIICKENEDFILADDAETFAHAVIELLTDSVVREKIGRCAMENVRKHYDWDENLAKLDSLLNAGNPI